MKIRLSIRTKLLFLSVAVLSIPYVGYQYLREMEQYLRDSLESSLTDAAIAVAGPLHNRQEFFPVTPEPDDSVFVHKLTHPMQLDGYTGDWMSYISWSDTYSTGGNGDPLSFRFIISRYQQYYYALLQVQDPDRVYWNPETPSTLNNDHVMLGFTSPDGDLRQYYFAPADAGEFTPFELLSRYDEFGFRQIELAYRTNISAHWRETDEGYNLEMSIPVNIIGERLGMVVKDVDNTDSGKVINVAGTAGPDTGSAPGRILQSSYAIEQTIESYARTDGRRIWVLDKHGQVLASTGNLARELSGASLNLFYSLIIPPVHQRFSDDLSGASRLQGEEINEALKGHPSSRWRTSPDDRAIIVSAAAPVMVNGEARGIVVVEETTSRIQIQQRQAMATLFNKSLFVFLFVTVLLLVFATRLSVRIRKLESDATGAIDKHGRVTGDFRPSTASDEIGDLSRNYAAMLKRLKHYNEYLENMAGRLSHELRTPIAVVQSSLDQFNDATEQDEKLTYLERARKGVIRLNTIVLRLSEATRLEQALQTADKQLTNIPELLDTCVAGYRSAFLGVEFRLHTGATGLTQEVAADLIVQMLDKLVGNAVDFRMGAEPVEISLSVNEESWSIAVSNHGPPLPEAMLGQLFNSMVSVREKKEKEEPHLGLGLYIVRLIVEYHGGYVTAVNLEGLKGVRVEAVFPRIGG